ncbi:MAG: ATP-binding cassette domain-containing protein [Chloroflexi bacterium]|nr:MAG: ATP-binding cassette domain-containing protein [Chloroflexota bacterium]
MNASPLIDIQQITYTYPLQNKGKSKAQSPKALQNVSLQIQPGEYLAVLGHNGSGKSTLARHCNALLIPDSGRVLVKGLDTSNKADQRAIRDCVGMIFQNPDNQIIATVVEDDVAWALAVRGLPVNLIFWWTKTKAGDCWCAGFAPTMYHCGRSYLTTRSTIP